MANPKPSDVRFNIQLDKEDAELLLNIAKEQTRSRSNLIRVILEDYIRDYKQSNK